MNPNIDKILTQLADIEARRLDICDRELEIFMHKAIRRSTRRSRIISILKTVAGAAAVISVIGIGFHYRIQHDTDCKQDVLIPIISEYSLPKRQPAGTVIPEETKVTAVQFRKSATPDKSPLSSEDIDSLSNVIENLFTVTDSDTSAEISLLYQSVANIAENPDFMDDQFSLLAENVSLLSEFPIDKIFNNEIK